MPKKPKTEEQVHELQAELNALNGLLIDSLVDSVAHLEHLVASILLRMDSQEHGDLIEQLQEIETIDEPMMAMLHVIGETTQDTNDKSSRESWWLRRKEGIAELSEASL